jgi:hypothetical protein
MPTLLVSCNAIERVARVVSVWDCTSTSQAVKVIESGSRHRVDAVVLSLIRSALGGPGSLTDALNVLDDAGVLAQRVRAAMMLGTHELALSVNAQKFLVYWPGSPRFSIEERDGLPVIKMMHPVVLDLARNVVTHIGANIRLRQRKLSYYLEVDPDDAEKIRGCWRPVWDGEPISEYEVVFSEEGLRLLGST